MPVRFELHPALLQQQLSVAEICQSLAYEEAQALHLIRYEYYAYLFDVVAALRQGYDPAADTLSMAEAQAMIAADENSPALQMLVRGRQLREAEGLLQRLARQTGNVYPRDREKRRRQTRERVRRHRAAGGK